jgi:hypothetical protein
MTEKTGQTTYGFERMRILLDLFAEDDWRNVYAGELELRPPGAPTTWPDTKQRSYFGKSLATTRFPTRPSRG